MTPSLDVYAVLFDIDGTLLDSTPAFLEIMRRGCEELGWPQPADDFMRQVMTFRRDPIEVLFGAQRTDAKQMREQIFEITQRIWQPLFQDLAHPFEDTVATLNSLKAAGFRLGIVTDSNHEVVRRVTEQPGCPPVDVIITREEAEVRKPDPTSLNLAIAGLGVPPSHVIYVGDNPPDIVASRAAGVLAVGITTGSSTRQDLLDAEPDAVIDNLLELPQLLGLAPPAVRGTLVTGLGEASGFTEVDWVKAAMTELLGNAPHPGTVNLKLCEGAAAVVARHRHDEALHRHLVTPEGDFCPAVVHRVTLHHGEQDHAPLPGLVLWPEVPDYPADKLEIILPVRLRDHWPVDDGQPLIVRYLAR